MDPVLFSGNREGPCLDPVGSQRLKIAFLLHLANVLCINQMISIMYSTWEKQLTRSETDWLLFMRVKKITNRAKNQERTVCEHMKTTWFSLWVALKCLLFAAFTIQTWLLAAPASDITTYNMNDSNTWHYFLSCFWKYSHGREWHFPFCVLCAKHKLYAVIS